MSNLNREDLAGMTLQRLAYVLPLTAEDEEMVKEIFDARASASTYQTLTTIDVKQGWQEQILQKYVNLKRETMAIENPASLTPEEESFLDAGVITKEKELELQDKLDKRNQARKGIQKTEETIVDAASENLPVPEPVIDIPEETPVVEPEPIPEETPEAEVTKVSKKKK